MFRVFKPAEKTYVSNGDKLIRPSKALVHKEDNGKYYLDFACGIEYAPWVKSGNIIVADTPQGAQPFRIMNPEITQRKITLKADHVFYDSRNYLIADSYVVSMDCAGALNHLNDATEPKSPFNTVSDVPTVDSFRCVRKSLYEAIQTVLERWGGHLVRDGWTIGIRQNIGADNGVTVRYGKNLKSITATYDWDNVVTKLLPTGEDGIMLNDLDPRQSIYMEAAHKYPIPFTKTVSFSQPDIKKEDYHNDDRRWKQALLADLRMQAQKYLDESTVPSVNYKMTADVSRITDVGDTIEVIDERIGLKLITHVISFEYDCIAKRYTSLEFGNFKKELSKLMDTVESTSKDAAETAVSSAMTGINDSLAAAQNAINSVMKQSYVVYDGSQILVVDSLPKESARNVIRIDSAGIGFSSTGIDGTFTSAWTIDGTLNMQAVNVINLTADLIRGGVLRLGGRGNGNGVALIQDASGATLGKMDNTGLTMNATDGSKIAITADKGLTGYDAAGNVTYGTTGGVFYVRNGYVDNSLAVGEKIKMVPIDADDNAGVAVAALA